MTNGTRFLIGETAVGALTHAGQIRGEREMIDITTLTDTARNFLPGVRDYGVVAVRGFFEAEDGGQSALRDAYRSGSRTSFTVELTDGRAVVFEGRVKSVTLGAAEPDAVRTFETEIRICGEVTLREAA